jgi:hypothetical protein
MLDEIIQTPFLARTPRKLRFFRAHFSPYAAVVHVAVFSVYSPLLTFILTVLFRYMSDSHRCRLERFGRWTFLVISAVSIKLAENDTPVLSPCQPSFSRTIFGRHRTKARYG